MRKKTLDSLGVSAFCESMAMMIQSGIPTDEAILLLQSGKADSKHSGGLLEEGLGVMKQSVERGEGLAAAMRAAEIFPDYALQMVEAGESSGRLEDILFRLSRYYVDQKTISDRLRSAVVYPASMLVLIIAVLAVMLVMVLPSFTEVYNQLTGSVRESTYSYIHWAYGLCWAALIVMVLIAAALIVGLLLWRGKHRDRIEALLCKNKRCRSIIESMGMFRFSSALATFLASGELQDEAVLKSIPMTDCKSVERKLEACVRSMEEGHSIAQAAYDNELFEPVYGRMLLAGERSGNLDNVLGRLTELLEENCETQVERLVGIVDPLLSGVLMLTVGLSLLSVMLPLIGMMNSVA